MTIEGRRALGRAVLTVAFGTLGFFVLEQPVRELEAAAAVALLRLFGTGGVFSAGATIAVFPQAHVPFVAFVTAACSSLPALLAIAALGSLTSTGPPARRVAAITAALGVVLLGNVVRIAASVAVGLVAGRSSLVLFHDWVGSAFTFAYAIGGYSLFLFLLLPRHSTANAEARAVAA